MTGLTIIADERRDQVVTHGFTALYDATNNSGDQLICAAVAVLLSDESYLPALWTDEKRKALEKPMLDRVTIAAALLVAEIEKNLFNQNILTVVHPDKHLSFSDALEAMKARRKVRRQKWVEEKKWLQYYPAEIPTDPETQIDPACIRLIIDEIPVSSPFMVQDDLLAEDWEIIS